MSGMILPRHVAEARREQKIAENIQKTSTHRIDSDDWALKKDVNAQLGDLQAYLDARREEEDYNLPQPIGWKLQVLMITIPEQSSGGLIIVDDAREQRSLATPQGVVLAMGEQCYRDNTRFEKPWCQIGDRILFAKYDAQTFQLGNGQRLGTLNDTQPFSIIDRDWSVPE